MIERGDFEPDGMSGRIIDFYRQWLNGENDKWEDFDRTLHRNPFGLVMEEAWAKELEKKIDSEETPPDKKKELERKLRIARRGIEKVNAARAVSVNTK